MRVLITGGAGFIGCHLASSLVRVGHEVAVCDVLDPQVHGPERGRPHALHPAVELTVGDVREPSVVRPLVEAAEVVVHLAASTGVGQSMYEVARYLDVNVTGTGVVLEALCGASPRPRRLVVASSRAVYGEGAYVCAECGPVVPASRRSDDLASGNWEARCPACDATAQPVATSEDTPPSPGSIYAVSKLAQEQAIMAAAAAWGFEAVALRLFNVYGIGQSPRNPYTGVVNAFLARALGGLASDVYEDGCASRDFVHIDAVAAALERACMPDAPTGVFNVGSGQRTTLLGTAQLIAGPLDAPAPVVSGRYRLADVRHCWADVARARRAGYYTELSLEVGLEQLVRDAARVGWVDEAARAHSELVIRGLGGRAAS